MDVRAAFLQAKGFNRTVFVRPPREEGERTKLWRLTAAAHGLADSGRLWYLTSDEALIKKMGLRKCSLEPTVYYKKDKHGTLSFLLATKVDNDLYTGIEEELSIVEDKLSVEFEFGTLERRKFEIYGCEIAEDSDYSITLTQMTKMSELSPTIDSRMVTKKGDDVATMKELSSYRRAIAQLLFIGRVSHPISLRVASHMATKTGALKSHHLKDLEALMRHCKSISPQVSFLHPKSVSPFILEVCSDASMASKKDEGARGGFILFRRSGDTVHALHWSSRKLRRVARSSSTAEILAAAEAVDIAIYVRSLLSELLYEQDLQLTSDSRSLVNFLSSTKEPEEKRNKCDIAAMREAFEHGHLHAVVWSPGYYLVSDALTKDNRTTAALLMRVLREDRYPPHSDQQVRITAKGEVWNSLNTFTDPDNDDSNHDTLLVALGDQHYEEDITRFDHEDAIKPISPANSNARDIDTNNYNLPYSKCDASTSDLCRPSDARLKRTASTSTLATSDAMDDTPATEEHSRIHKD